MDGLARASRCGSRDALPAVGLSDVYADIGEGPTRGQRAPMTDDDSFVDGYIHSSGVRCVSDEMKVGKQIWCCGCARQIRRA